MTQSFFQKRYCDLSTWLLMYQPLWQQSPFIEEIRWKTAYPELDNYLKNLPTAHLEKYAQSPQSLPSPPQIILDIFEQSRLFSTWQSLGSPNHPKEKAPPKVPERKWSQIQCFIKALQGVHNIDTSNITPQISHWVDWCCGKGHLGRTLGKQTQIPIIGIEYNGALCEQGAQLAKQTCVPMTFANQDVLNHPVASHLNSHIGVVALHACGQLNLTLLQKAVSKRCPIIAVAPCCYHNIKSTNYQPISKWAAQHPVPVGPSALRLTGFDEDVASPARKKQRRLEQWWRLSLDCVLKRHFNKTHYTPLGPAKRAWLLKDFVYFCEQITQQYQITLPANTDYQWALNQGQTAVQTARALGLIRHFFKRPIESLLFLDRLLFLEEYGYHITAGTFCPSRISPRNLMVVATLTHNQSSID